MKKCLGIQIESRKARFALCRGREVLAFQEEVLPPGLAEEGSVLDWEEMGALLEKKAGIFTKECGQAAVVLPDKLTYVARLQLPDMSRKQVKLNLPYELQELPWERGDYILDYEVLERTEREGEGKYLELLAGAAQKALIEKYRELVKRLGMRLVLALPEAVVYQGLIDRAKREKKEEVPGDFALLYLGEERGKLCMFRKGRYETGKELEAGAEDYSVPREQDRIGLEVMRALNFFQYTYPQSSVYTLYCWGIGIDSPGLLPAIKESAGVKVIPAWQLFSGKEENPFVYEGAAAAIAWDRNRR